MFSNTLSFLSSLCYDCYILIKLLPLVLRNTTAMTLLEVYVEENYYKFISSISGIAVTLQVSGFVTSLSPTAKN